MTASPELKTLRDAYRELPHQQKRQIRQALQRHDTHLSQAWLKRAHLHGWTQKPLANCAATVAARLDLVLLKPAKGDEDILPSVTNRALMIIRDSWAAEVRAKISEATGDTTEIRLDEVLADLAARHADKPFWRIFAASARLAPQFWLKSGPAPTAGETPPASTAGMAVRPPAGDRSPLAQQLDELDAVLVAARIAKPFDAAGACRLVSSIEASGVALRKSAARLAATRGSKPVDWRTLVELETHVAGLEAGRLKASRRRGNAR